MAKIESTQPTLHKYMRQRKVMSKTGFYLEIKGNGEVSCTRDAASIYSKLLFLTVGPNLVAIVGEHVKHYLAVDEQGKIFTSINERKDCVFREFFGRNFFTLFRTCHSDPKGRGWYLSIDERGRVRAEKVSYSGVPQLHFIVKLVKEKPDEAKNKKSMKDIDDDESVWKRRSSESLIYENSRDIDYYSLSSSPGSSSDRSEYASPVSFSVRSEYGSPVSFARRSEYGSPVGFDGRSQYGSPVSFSGRSQYGSPVSFSGQSEYGSPLSFFGPSEQASPSRSVHVSPASPIRSGHVSPASLSGSSSGKESVKSSERKHYTTTSC